MSKRYYDKKGNRGAHAGKSSRPTANIKKALQLEGCEETEACFDRIKCTLINKLQSASNSSSGTNNMMVEALFFDLDGVLAAEMLGQTLLTKMIFYFYEHKSGCEGMSCLLNNTEKSIPCWVSKRIFRDHFKINLPENFNEGEYLPFLGKLWQSLHITAAAVGGSEMNKDSTSSDIVPLDEKTYRYLATMYEISKTSTSYLVPLRAKYIFQSCAFGHEYFSNLPPLPIGIANFNELKALFPSTSTISTTTTSESTTVTASNILIEETHSTIAIKEETTSHRIFILSSIPNPYPHLTELRKLLNEPSEDQIIPLFENMDRNNILGKKLWLKKYLGGLLRDENILIVSKGQSKREFVDDYLKMNNLSHWIGKCALIDDLKKNTDPFGPLGFQVPEGGFFEV